LNTKRGTLGVSKFSTFIGSNGLRSSAATAYLPPSVIARKNLTIAVESQVCIVIFLACHKSDRRKQTTRVIFSTDEAIPRAIGVEIAKNGSSYRYRVAAKKEIILSAGALGTPQIMMLSGVGAREELERINIPVIKDLPAVGKNLSDVRLFIKSSLI
jgi:choline dehydrogenase